MAQVQFWSICTFLLKTHELSKEIGYEVDDSWAKRDATWTVAAIPDPPDPNGGMSPEATVRVEDFSIRRNGPGGNHPGQVHLNFKLRNLSGRPAHGHIVASAISAGDQG